MVYQLGSHHVVGNAMKPVVEEVEDRVVGFFRRRVDRVRQRQEEQEKREQEEERKRQENERWWQEFLASLQPALLQPAYF